MRTIAIALLFCLPFSATAQLMNADKEARLRSYIPKIDDNRNIRSKIDQAMLYTDEEIPPAYQFQPLGGGNGLPYTVFFSPRHRHNNIDKYTQMNSEFPWADAGGLNYVDKSKVSLFRFIWLPPRDDGGMWPIVVRRAALQRSTAVNMPTPTQGYRWDWPIGAIVGEVMLKQFADDSWACWEMRLRLREEDDWEVEVYRPFSDLDSLTNAIPNGHEAFQNVGVTYRVMKDTNHPRSAFDRGAGELTLPPIPNALELLRTTTFKPVSGSIITQTASYSVEAFTATDTENIVPAFYSGGYLGTMAESCRNCHKDTLRHADSFSSGRDWYGYARGSQGIFSFHPIEPDAIRPYGNGQTRLRAELVRAGYVAMKDDSLHPEEVYKIMPQYENAPDQNGRVSGNRRIIGGSVSGR